VVSMVGSLPQSPRLKSSLPAWGMAGEENAILAPHRNWLFLGLQDDKPWLAHGLTQEKVLLPQAPVGESWELLFTDDEGMGYLDCGSESQWAQDLLKKGIFVAPSGELHVASSSGLSSVKSLAEYQADHELTKIVVEVGLSRASVTMRSALFRQRAGARVWWSIEDLCPDRSIHRKGSPAKWIYGCMKALANLAERLGLEPVHLRRSQPLAPPEGAEVSSETERVLDCPGMSTHLVLAACAKFAGLPRALGGLAKHEERASMKLLFKGVLELLGPHDGGLTIFVDSQCKWRPPLPPSGCRPVHLSCKDGHLDLAPLQAALPQLGCSDADALHAAVSGLAPQLPIHEVLVAAVAFGKKAR
jgi:hypothetical protein